VISMTLRWGPVNVIRPDNSVINCIDHKTFTAKKWQWRNASALHRQRLGTLPPDLVRDSDTEIARLAGLARIQYARERKAAAKSLGVGVSELDAAIREERKESTRGQGKPLSLPEPEPWAEPVAGQELLSDLIAGLRRYMVMDENETTATALWIVHCHALEAFNVSPRLAITSPEKGCGKTTLLDILGVMVPRPLSTANTGVAPVFRAIEMAQPTLLIDEADTFVRENNELRGILNSGHRKGGHVLRTVGEDHEPRMFSTWSPLAIAMIGRLPDTLEHRSISVRLRRRRPGETVTLFRIDRTDELERLARMAARWAIDNVGALSAADPVIPSILNNRAQDNCGPLLAISDQIGGEWPNIVRRAAEDMAATASGNDQSVGVMLLTDICDIFRIKGTDRLSSEDLLASLISRDDRPWPECKNGKPMTKAGLAHRLNKFGIIPENIRFAGTGVLKGYHLHRFEDAFSRYLPAQTATPVQPNNDGGFSQNQTATHESPVALSNCEKPLQHSDCSDVALCETPVRENNVKDGANEVCAQCRAGVPTGGDPPTQKIIRADGSTAWLHRECRRFWKGDE
jgi:putative DNA primase/helicase